MLSCLVCTSLHADYSYAPSRSRGTLGAPFRLHGTNNEARKVPPNAVLANNSIILRLNHSKLTHFRRRQRHINYDSDVPKQAGRQPGAEECVAHRNLSYSLSQPTSVSIGFWGLFFLSFCQRDGKKQIQNVFSPDVLCLSSQVALIVGSKSYSAHSRERENGFSWFHQAATTSPRTPLTHHCHL